MNDFPTKATVERLRRLYPQGTQVQLVRMDDPYTTLKPGDRGPVDFVDIIGAIFCLWDNGSTLGVAYGVDEIFRVNEEDVP